MASFQIRDCTARTVTLSISELTAEEEEIYVFVRPVTEGTGQTVDKFFIPTVSSMLVTISGLTPGTDYLCNVRPGGSDVPWIGSQSFNTLIEAIDATGRVTILPAIRSDFPLFAWSDWPDSYAALVSGGLTGEFEKEAWNAIIDHLNELLSEASGKWLTTYTTVGDAKITEHYGDLYAKAFNSVAHNIFMPVPILWAWETNTGFWGYVDKRDFISGDVVYASYIKELVRRLNLLIGIMRGSTPTPDSSSRQQARSLYRAAPNSGLSQPARYQDRIYSLSSAIAHSALAVPGFPARQSAKTDCLAQVYARTAVPAKTMAMARSDYRCKAYAHVEAPWSHKASVNIQHRVVARRQRGVPCLDDVESLSQHLVEALARESLPFSAGAISKSVSRADAWGQLSVLTSGSARANSTYGVTAGRDPARRLSINMASRSSCDTQVDTGRNVAMTVGQIVKTLTHATIGSAWEPSEWVGDGLWIRQSHQVTQTDNTLEVI